MMSRNTRREIREVMLPFISSSQQELASQLKYYIFFTNIDKRYVTQRRRKN